MARLTLDWMQLVAALGAVHGVLLAGVLASQRRNRTANRLLAALMAAFTLYLASSVYYAVGLVDRYPHFFGVSYPLPWLFGPLVYLYAVAASDRSWRFARRDLLHLLPVALVVVVGLPYYLLGGPGKAALYERLISGDEHSRMAWIDPSKYVSGIAYSVATILHLRRHQRRIEDSYSNTARVNLGWLLGFAGAAATIWILATMLGVMGVEGPVREEHVTLAIAILVYGIGYMGLRQPEVFRYATAEYPVPIPQQEPAVAPPGDDGAAGSRYERSGLGDREAEALRESLVRQMEEERLWRDSELTLADLAARVRSTPHKVSEVLNSQVGQTFHDFVNGYRVREVQRRIEAGEARRLKMLALAYDAGFASKSTFNQAFKKHTSQTPSDFRAAVGA